MAKKRPKRTARTALAHTPEPLAKRALDRLDWPNLLAGGAIGVALSLPFYLLEKESAAAQKATYERNIQLILGAIEQTGASVKLARDGAGAIVGLRVEIGASGKSQVESLADLETLRQDK